MGHEEAPRWDPGLTAGSFLRQATLLALVATVSVHVKYSFAEKNGLDHLYFIIIPAKRISEPNLIFKTKSKF